LQIRIHISWNVYERAFMKLSVSI